MTFYARLESSPTLCTVVNLLRLCDSIRQMAARVFNSVQQRPDRFETYWSTVVQFQMYIQSCCELTYVTSLSECT